MSDNFVASDDLLVTPAEPEEQFLTRLEYNGPILKASVWLYKLIVHRIRDVDAVAPFYRGKDYDRKIMLISYLLNQSDRRSCKRFEYWIHSVKKYKQGHVPPEAVKDVHRTALIFVQRLEVLLDNSETIRLLRRRINDLFDIIMANDFGKMPRNDYLAKLDRMSESILTLFGRISDEFNRKERIIRGEAAEPATRADVAKAAEESRTRQNVALTVIHEVAKTTARMDRRLKRTKSKPKGRYTFEELRQINNIWVTAQSNQKVKELCKGKPCYEGTCIYFAKELRLLRVYNAADMSKARKAYSRRIAKGNIPETK